MADKDDKTKKYETRRGGDKTIAKAAEIVDERNKPHDVDWFKDGGTTPAGK